MLLLGTPGTTPLKLKMLPGGRERALQLVAADDLPHVDEDRRVGIAQLDDVEERLLLPGIGHRRGVVEPVTVERHRSVARAAGEAGHAHQDADPRGKGTDLDRERVRHQAARSGAAAFTIEHRSDCTARRAGRSIGPRS